MQICRSPFFQLLWQKITGASAKNAPAPNPPLGEILGQIPALRAGHNTRCLKLSAAGVTALTDNRPNHKITFMDMVAPAKLKTGRTFACVIITPRTGRKVKLVGVPHAAARKFTEALNTAWRKAAQTQLDKHAKAIEHISKALDRLDNPRRYPSACLLHPFVKMAQPLAELAPLPEAAIGAEQQAKLAAIKMFYQNPQKIRDTAIEQFIAGELEQMTTFFDTIESNPLTPEQRLAVVTDEDATLVLAAAGSGKTSVIVAKAAYLIERKIRAPDEILLMCFARDAATEMTERINERCGAPVDSRTFHSLAHTIIAQVEGNASSLAAHASDEAGYVALLREIILRAAKLADTATLLLDWFCDFYRPYKSDLDFNSLGEYYAYVKEQELRTLGGELVKSFEELEIANWLYRNGIAYEYEPDYEHPLPDSGRGTYTPDFRLTNSGVYIEHFGVRKQTDSKGRERLTTAPYVPREDYLAGMEWKRETHKTHGTILIETYSYEKTEGRLIRNLAERLAEYETFAPIPPERVFDRLDKMGEIDSFTGLLGTFLKHFKGAGMTIAQCRQRNRDLGFGARGGAFLKIFKIVFSEYQARLDSEQKIDFEDMILRATDYIKDGKYKSPFRHILVDEFQDISKSRAALLRALQACHAQARIFAVGDDWQSIYRFAGSDVQLMSNFGAEFGGVFGDAHGVHQTIDLGRTFRSVDKIALPARRFVLENPAQIRKEVKTLDTTDTPSIFVVHSEWEASDAALDGRLKNIADAMGGRGKVLLLGRYRYMRPKHLGAICKRYPRLDIEFKTIHGSKGLEADHVIILGANSGRGGLPSEIVDDPLLNLVLPTPELFSHAEERRVFYVALTRARRGVTILALKNRPSSFVTELLGHPDYGVIEIGGEGVPPAPCPKCGGRMVARTGRYGRFWSCVNYSQFRCAGTRRFEAASEEEG